MDIETGTSVCCDAFAWFQAGFISSPSMSVYGMPGLGKTSWAVRQMIGLADRGVVSVVAGDLKGEYGNVVRALGGQVLGFGGGQHINVLDQGAMLAAAARIGGDRGLVLVGWAVERAADMVATLVQIVRRAPVNDWEQTLLRRAIRLLVDHHRPGTPVGTLEDLAGMLSNPPQALIEAILADTRSEYDDQTKPLRRSMQALIQGQLGTTFAGQTTEQIRLDAPAVSVDISVVAKQSEEVLAAVMLATWSEVFATIEAANALTDAGLQPQRYINAILDEMWKAMRLRDAGLVEKLDGITRLNRNDGVGNMFITHSLKDYTSLESEADQQKALGFAERSGVVVTAGLAEPDLRELSTIKRLSEREIATVAAWSTPQGWQSRMTIDPTTGLTRPAIPPGAGKVLIKVGSRAGIQTQVQLTSIERQLHDSNARWTQVQPVG
jgi:hypothetical protein